MEGGCSAYEYDHDLTWCWDKNQGGSTDPENPVSINQTLLSAVRQGNLDLVRNVFAKVGEHYFKTFVDSYKLVEEAVSYQRVCMLKLLLALGAAVDKSTHSHSLLHFACKKGDLSLARCLIQAGACVNKRDSAGSFPLHYAAQTNLIKSELTKYGRSHTSHYYKYISSQLTLLLLENEATFLNSLDHDKMSPLHYAVLSDNINTVSILIEYDANINFKGLHGRTPLWYAVYIGRIKLTEMLLEAGDKTAALSSDDLGLTLLHVAVRRKDPHMTLFLLNYFKRKSLLDKIINKPNNDLQTCLHCAAASLDVDIINYLIAFGASVNLENNFGNTPLIMACCGYNCDDLIELDYSYNRYFQPVKPIVYEEKIDETHSCHYCSVVKVLIKSGSFVKHSNFGCQTALHMAAKRNILCVAKILLDQGALVDHKDDDGLTPLHLSVEHESFELVTLLLERGADPDAKGEEYLTPLHLAAIRAEDSCENTLNLISLLVEYNADINARNIVNMTPLYLIIRNALDGQYSPNITPRIVDFFLLNGADVLAQSSFGRSAFTTAASRLLSGNTTPCDALHQILLNICIHAVKIITAIPPSGPPPSYETSCLILELIGPSKLFGGEQDFYVRCLEEVSSLKRNYLSSDISFHDLLTLQIEVFSKRLRNQEFEEDLSNNVYLDTFPIYGPIIQSRYVRALKRKENIDAGHHFFACLSENFNYPRLPLICVDIILKYFGVSDFKHLHTILYNE